MSCWKAQTISTFLVAGRKFFLDGANLGQEICVDQFSSICCRMRAFLALNIFILALGIGYGFRVNDVLDTLGGIVEDTQRQSDVNDKVPAVFAATLGASLIANAVLNPKDGLNRIGNTYFAKAT